MPAPTVLPLWHGVQRTYRTNRVHPTIGSAEAARIGRPRASSVPRVRCPACAHLDDKVVDSRVAEEGAAIRRRRECLTCGHRFTTFERLEEIPLVVVKRSGDRVPFERAKIVGGLRAAAKNRPLREGQLTALAVEVEEALQLAGGGDVSSEAVGRAVLEHLRGLDAVAYVRFASVYKGFDDLSDFEREVTMLAKDTEPKRH